MPPIQGHTKQGRRQFVKTAAAAVATAQFPILGANDRVNLAVVGLGGRGGNHVDFYSTLSSECRLAAGCAVLRSMQGAVGGLKSVRPRAL